MACSKQHIPNNYENQSWRTINNTPWNDIIIFIRYRALLSIRLLSGVPDFFYRNKISSGGDLSHYSSASLY